MARNNKLSPKEWQVIRERCEAGAPMKKMAEEYGISPGTVSTRRKREGWAIPRTSAARSRKVAEQIVEERASRTSDDPDKGPVMPAGRSVGQPMGEFGADVEALSKTGALNSLPAPDGIEIRDSDASPASVQAQVEIELMRKHRKTINRAATTADNILQRLHALVVEGSAADVISFKTKAGKAYHRVPFLGDRESVSDALLKCVNAVSKLVPLERQAHGLKDEVKDDKLPQITFNMPGLKVVNVDGKGQVVRGGQIEGKATDVT